MQAISVRSRSLVRKGMWGRVLGIDILEDRLTPSAVDMSWSTSLPYDVVRNGQTLSMPGQGVSLSEHHQLTYSSTMPELTPDMEARLDRWADRPVNDTPAFPDRPDARPGTTPAQAELPKLAPPEGGTHTTAPNDFTFFRNRTNEGGDDPTAQTSNVNEPSVGALNRAVFETGNWYASVSGTYGGNFAYIDPATSFGNVGGSFCCDQRVANDNNNNQLLWYLQYDDNGSFGGVRIARAVGQNGIVDGSWTSWTFTPQSFGFAATGKWLDFPHMQVSGTRLWATSNVFNIGGATATDAVIWTIPLADLLAGGAANYSYWVRQDGFSIAPAQNAGSTMYLASYINTTDVRFYSTPESPLALSTSLKTGLNASYNGTHNTVSPDGNNWTGRASNRMQTVTLSGNTLTSMWNTAQGGTRPNSFMRILQVNVASAYATIQDYDFWFSAGTAHYPAAAVNARGHLGVTYFFGDATRSASPTVFLVDDIQTTFNAGTFGIEGFNGGNNRWGDYVQTQIHNVYDNTWLSSSYRLTAAGPGAGHQPAIAVRYMWYGRERDTPAFTLGSISDVGDIIGGAVVTGLTGSSGSYSRTDQIWSIDNGRRDVDMYRFTANFATRVEMETTQPAGGDSMDTYLRLFSSGGTALGFDDDAGAGAYSLLRYTTQSTANYYVGISGYSNSTYSPTTAGSGTLGAMGDFVINITLSAATTFTSIATITSPRNSAISTLDFTSSRTLNLATFNYADLSLTRNGGANLITSGSGVTVTLVSGTTYRINGLSGLTGVEGNYELSVIGAGVDDTDGFDVYGSIERTWTVDTTAPQILDIVNVSPDPRNTALTTIRVVFSEPVPSVLYTALTFTRNGSPITFNGNESYTAVGGNAYDIGNLGDEAALEGSYSFTLAGPNFFDAAGNAGTGTQSDTWVQDFTAPQILDVVDISPDPRSTVVTTIRVVFSEPVPTVLYSALTLLRNGSPVTFSGNETYTPAGGNAYDIGNLGEETALEGAYSFTLAGPNFFDPAGNPGSGTQSDTWVQDFTAPSIVAMYFDGVLDSDGAGPDAVWAAAFRTAAGNATYGYPAQTGAGQMTSMPWTTVDTVYIKFSEDVIASIGQLAATGVNVAGYPVSSWGYDSVNFVARWTFSGLIDTDKITLTLDGITGTAVRDAAGNKVAGTWTEGVSTFPTSGAAGVNFVYRFKSGVGDADRNGIVRNADLNLVRNQLFVDAGMGGYSIYGDIDGNGITRNADLNAVRTHLFVDPPAAPPPPTGRANRGTSIASGGRAPIAVRAGNFASSPNQEYFDRTTALRRTAAVWQSVQQATLDEALASFA